VWALAEDGRPVSARAYFDRSRLAVAASRRQLAEVAEDLMEQAAEIRRQWSRLGDALRAAGLEEAAAEASEAAEYVNGAGGESSALLVAVDMAQEGSTREEVDAYLRDELGVEDTSELLDEVFSSAEGAAPGSADQAGVVDASRLTRLFARNRG
jgi:hypothetical protein